jgi:5'-methylthioadenosine phosphorylase
MLAIIGGSGLTQLAALAVTRKQIVRTPYGEPSGPLTVGTLGGAEVMFLARHGYGHTLAPHEINYRANLWGLKDKGATRIVSVCSVGGIDGRYTPGAIVIPSQIIDYTSGRHATFFEGAEQAVVHVDFTHPYCEATRRLILDASADAGVAALEGGTYAATQGPRLETAAEVDRLERDGAHLVGMTGMPEAVLARELELPYAAVAVVVNAAAGWRESAGGISQEAMGPVLRESMGRVLRILEKVVVRHAAANP